MSFDNTALMLRTATVRLRKYEKRYLENTKSIFYKSLVEKTNREISELKTQKKPKNIW